MSDVIIHPVHIGDRQVGPGQPTFVVAEAGVNHNGRLETAKQLVQAAATAGADAVKFQTFTPEDVIVRNAPKAPYQLQTTAPEESQFEMLRELALDYDDFRTLKRVADDAAIMFLSTPYSLADVEFLSGIGVPAFKIASIDIANYPLLSGVGRRNVPVVASTGMATLGEVERGLRTLREAGCTDVVLLHCVTNYPIRDGEANLCVMDTLAQAFQVPVGFSDHTTGTVVPLAAVARGACLIEKHLTLDRTMTGPDHAASLDPAAFGAMMEGIRAVESSLGSPVKALLPVERSNRRVMRRSLVAAQDLPVGTVLRGEHLALKRPGDGLGAEFIELLVGQRLRRALPQDEQLALADVEFSRPDRQRRS